jgi:hypothetical protein
MEHIAALHQALARTFSLRLLMTPSTLILATLSLHPQAPPTNSGMARLRRTSSLLNFDTITGIMTFQAEFATHLRLNVQVTYTLSSMNLLICLQDVLHPALNHTVPCSYALL